MPTMLRLRFSFRCSKRASASTAPPYLRDAFVFYEARRYDIKGKKYLSTQAKHYVCDSGMRYAVLGTRDMDWGRMYENAVFLS